MGYNNWDRPGIVPKAQIYLAGPIAGGSYSEVVNWRENVANMLADHGIRGVSPMRGKTYLSQEKELGCLYKSDPNRPLSSTRGTVVRDKLDCTTCDMVFLNLRGAKRISIGSMIEVGWASAYDIPIVLIIEEGNVHEHGFLKEIPAFRVDSVQQAVQIAASFFNI